MIINLWLLKLSPASTWRQCYLPLPTPSLTFPRSSQFVCILYWSIESVKQQYYKLLYKSLYFFTLHMCSCSFSHVRNLTHSYLEAKLITQLFSWCVMNSLQLTINCGEEEHCVCSIWISSCFFDLPPLFLWERWIWQKQKIFKNTYYAIFRNGQ